MLINANIFQLQTETLYTHTYMQIRLNLFILLDYLRYYKHHAGHKQLEKDTIRYFHNHRMVNRRVFFTIIKVYSVS